MRYGRRPLAHLGAPSRRKLRSIAAVALAFWLAGPGYGVGHAQQLPQIARAVLAKAGASDRHLGDRSITMDFQDVEIGVLAKFISEATGRSFIVDDRVRGTVTIIAPEPITPEEAYSVFQSVLQVKGFTTIPAGRAVKIVPSNEAKGTTLRTLAGAEAPSVSAEEFVTRIERIERAEAAGIAAVLEPLVSRDGLVRAYEPTNTLLLIDTAANLERLLKVARHLDSDRESASIEVVRLRHAVATDIAPLLTTLVEAGGETSEDRRAGSLGRATIVAEEQSNALVLRAPRKQLAELESLVAELDVPPVGQHARLNVYPLKYADADILADVLNRLVGATELGRRHHASRVLIGARGGTTRFPSPPRGASLAPGARAQTPDDAGASLDPTAASELTGSVRITADPATNSLLVSAAPQDFSSLSSIIAHLDVPRPQVYVEAILLEVTIDRARAMGFDLINSGSVGDGTGLAAFSLRNAGAAGFGDPTGLAGLILAAASQETITLPDGTEVPAKAAVFRALQQDSDINVLSAPTILTTDNEEAEIVVGQNVPFIASRATSEDNLDNLFTTVERHDVGITLRLTPQITEGETVRLTIFEEVSALTSPPVDAPDTDVGPTTTVRSASTTVVVDDGNTVVIGGLLADTTREMERGVPYIRKIPVLGHLFRQTDTIQTKTNLLIFLTPRIVRTQGIRQVEAESAADDPLAGVGSASRATRVAALRAFLDGRPADGVSHEWEVQAGASHDPARAEAIVGRLATKGYRAFILRAEDSGDVWHRVRIGGLQSEAEAQGLARELVSEGFAGAFVPTR